MSTGMRMSFANAVAKAGDFLNLIKPEITCERFEWAGSLRRKRADVGDFDACAIPKFVDLASDDMFGTPTTTNLLWHRIDDLVRLGTFARHVKQTAAGPREKWGQSCRAIEFRGCSFEIQTADPDNFGVWLAIRTGPATLSQALVMRVPRSYKFDGSFHVIHQQSGDRLKQLSEEKFFGLVGLPYLLPEKR